MIDNYLKPLEMFKDYIKVLPQSSQIAIKSELKKRINEEFDNPVTIKYLKDEETEYDKKFKIFMILLCLLGGISIIVLSYLIIKFNKTSYKMGHFITLKVTDKKTVFLEWFLEVLVTLCLVLFIFIYFNYIIYRYIYANIMDIFTVGHSPKITVDRNTRP